MSALLLCADFVRTDPVSALCPTSLFDHLVDAGKQCRWNVETERLGGLAVDRQLELRRLLDRQIGSFAASLRNLSTARVPIVDSDHGVRAKRPRRRNGAEATMPGIAASL